MIDFNSHTMLPDRINAVIDKALQVENAKQKPRDYLGASGLGAECERAIQYEYWKTPKDEGKEFPGKILRIFERGHWAEDALAKWLYLAGCKMRTVDKNGYQFEFKDGIMKGHCDGFFMGGPDIFGPFPRIWESKCIGAKYWKKMSKNKLKKENPTYYAQCHIYMHYFDLKENPALFSAINADTMEIYWEDIEFDPEYWKLLDAKIKRIMEAIDKKELLPKVRDDPTYFKCKWCNWYQRCYKENE